MLPLKVLLQHSNTAKTPTGVRVKKCQSSPISLFYSIELILLLELRKLLKYDAMSHYSMNKVDYLDGSRGKTLCDVLITNAPMSLPVVR